MAQVFRAISIGFLLTLIAPAMHAQPAAFIEGTHFKEVRKAEPSEGKITVTEVFWYGCPHCYAFDPSVEEWKEDLAEDVEFERLPTALGRASGRIHVKAYFTAQALGVAESVHKAMFAAIHEKGQRLTSEAEISKVFEAVGVPPEDFTKAFNSFSVEGSTRRAERRIADLGIHSVPTVVVDGRWEVGAAMAGSFPTMIRIIDFLVAKARDAR